MKKLNLADDSGETGASSGGSNRRQKRLRIILLVVLLVGAAAIAAQQFFFKEKKPAPELMRPPVASIPPSPPASSAPPVKPSEPVPPSPGTAPVSAPSFPPAPAKGDQTKELSKPSGLPAAPAAPASSMKRPEVVPPLPATTPASGPSLGAPSPKAEQVRELAKPSKSQPRASAEEGKTHRAHGYALQVLACADEKNASEALQKLKNEGFSPEIVKTKTTLTRHSIYLGDFSGPEEAAALGIRMKEDKISATLHMTEGGRYSYLISSYYTLNEAVDASHALEEKGYPVGIRETTAQDLVYQVRIRHFADPGQAAAPIQHLRDLGYSPIVVRE
jgi:hypothetical protein